MANLQIKTNDSFYFRLVEENKIDELRIAIGSPSWFKKINRVIAFPNVETLKKEMSNDDVAFISADNILNNGLLVIKNLPNSHDGGIRNKQQVDYEEDINSELYNKFGMVVSNPTTTFSDLGGFEEPKQEMLRTQQYVKEGLVQKNLAMFLGVSRSGKSFFAECLAGELNYRLIILDLGVIMCDSNPPKKLDEFFMYLENIDNYVLLIDEIEKAADPEGGAAMARVMIGKLLTVFNNFNSESGFNIKANFVIATANNILTLLNKNPEFINRFGLKYFVNYPVKKSFIDVSTYYMKKMKIKGLTGEDVFNLSASVYARDEIPKMEATEQHVKYGKYASGEIKEFMANLLLFCEKRENEAGLFCNLEILRKVLHLQKPQIQFAKNGVIATIEAAKIANFREVR